MKQLQFVRLSKSVQEIYDKATHFKSMLGNYRIRLEQWSQRYDGSACPTQDELRVVLNIFGQIAENFSDFLSAFSDVLDDEDQLTPLIENPDPVRNAVLDGKELLPVYWTINSLGGKLGNHDAGRTFHWDVTSDLAITFAYYGSSMSAASSLISSMSIITYILGGDELGRREFAEFAPRLLKREYPLGLKLMAKRAELIATHSEGEIRATELSWWCDRFDMTPKDQGNYYNLSYLIGSCPAPEHPHSIERFKSLSSNQDVDEKIRTMANDRLTR